MTISMIRMSHQDARARYVEYRRAVLGTPNARDEVLMRGYRALSKGKTVLDLAAVIRQSGLDEKFRPRLAIARADAERVVLKRYFDGGVRFDMNEEQRPKASRRYVQLPPRTFDWGSVAGWASPRASALVPLIPPRLRPRGILSNYHILWEAAWEDVPKDPILLRRISGLLFVVLARWDLTALERAVLRR